MLGVSSLGTLEAMAERGDLSRVDLTVRDIAGGPIVEVVSVLSIAAARACGQEDIVMTGKLTRIFRFMQKMKRLNFGYGRFIIPEHADYATAIGAARTAAQGVAALNSRTASEHENQR